MHWRAQEDCPIEIPGLIAVWNILQEIQENTRWEPLEVHIEKKGRGGKTAVIVKGFEGSEEALKDLAKDLKSHCATGGSVKDGEIIIQGDLRPKVMDFLHKKSFKTKRVGG